MLCRFIFAGLTLFSLVEAVPLFNTISLEEFGAIDNSNVTVQPGARFSPSQPVRTNDFQVLQQTFADDRQAIRINQLYATQGSAGPGIVFPVSQQNSLESITTPTDDQTLIFTATELTDTASQAFIRSTQLLSSQAFTNTYTLPPPGLPVPISSFTVTEPTVESLPPQFFVFYQSEVPELTTDGVAIQTVTVDGVLTPLNATRIEGAEVVLRLDNGKIYYLSAVKSANPLVFVIEEGGTKLRALAPFTGALRLACDTTIDSTKPTFEQNFISPYWQTNGPTVDALTVDGVPVVPLDVTAALPPGRNFQLLLSSGERWELTTDPLLPPLQLVLSQERTSLRAAGRYAGAVQIACRTAGQLIAPTDFLTFSPTTIPFVPLANIAPPRTPEQTIRAYHIIGNAYHDIEYNQLTPQLQFSSSPVRQLFIDGVQSPFSSPLPAGRKFKFVLENGQQWLIYVEQSVAPISFILDSDRITLAAITQFTGVLRVATLLTDPLPDLAPQLNPPQFSQSWSTAAATQTTPPTPLSSYILWPVEWINRLGPEIRNNIPQTIFVPACSRIVPLLPPLAEGASNPVAQNALSYFTQIDGTQYALGDNPFLTAFMLLLTSNLKSDIATYQATFRTQPNYGITPTATLTEATYDAYRSVIPVAADIHFVDDAYCWIYTCVNNAQNPLIVFPGYKTVDPLFVPIAGFGYLDPIKGPLYGVEAIDGKVSFAEGPLPPFFDTRFIPETFVLSGSQLNLLTQTFFDVFESVTVTPATNVLDAGKQVYELALSATYAVFMFDAARNGQVRFFTQPLIDEVKNLLDAWLINRSSTNFFIGDRTTPGVTANAGMFSATSNVNNIDNGNAIYNDHHTQYGFWLGAVALVMKWDARFLPANEQWITGTVTTSSGTLTIRKSFVDMLWRDTRNVDKDDGDHLPYNRHGNPWEGHSTSNGLLYSPLAQGRFQEHLAQDFNSWVSVAEYAKNVLNSPFLTAADKVGFDLLQIFARTNLQLTATSGKLYYQDNNWLYPFPYNVNTTIGQVYDTQTVASPSLTQGSPPCSLLTR